MKEILGSISMMIVFGTCIGSILIGIASCNEQQQTKQIPQEPIELSKDNENYHHKVYEFTYEGCEYIKVGFGKGIWGSHKGNCQNLIHKGQHPSPYIFDLPESTLQVEDTLKVIIPD